MEKLADALRLRIAGNRIHPRECHARKTGRGREISRKSQRTHSAAVSAKRNIFCKRILRLLRGKPDIVVEHKHLLCKRRIVRENAHRILVDMQTIRHRFHRNRLVFVCDDPVQLGRRELLGERRSDQIHFCKKRPHLIHRRALAEHPRDELK